jgi:hypothetical protein
MMYQICHDKPIVFATTSRKLKRSLSDDLDFRPSRVQKQQLTDNFVKYIVVHKRLISKKNELDVAVHQKYYGARHEDSHSIVFQIY